MEKAGWVEAERTAWSPTPQRASGLLNLLILRRRPSPQHELVPGETQSHRVTHGRTPRPPSATRPHLWPSPSENPLLELQLSSTNIDFLFFSFPLPNKFCDPSQKFALALLLPRTVYRVSAALRSVYIVFNVYSVTWRHAAYLKEARRRCS